jgi:hypothetical protein
MSGDKSNRNPAEIADALQRLENRVQRLEQV